MRKDEHKPPAQEIKTETYLALNGGLDQEDKEGKTCYPSPGWLELCLETVA